MARKSTLPLSLQALHGSIFLFEHSSSIYFESFLTKFFFSNILSADHTHLGHRVLPHSQSLSKYFLSAHPLPQGSQKPHTVPDISICWRNVDKWEKQRMKDTKGGRKKRRKERGKLRMMNE